MNTRIAAIATFLLTACAQSSKTEAKTYSVKYDCQAMLRMTKDEIISKLGAPTDDEMPTKIQAEQGMPEVLDYSLNGFDISIELNPQNLKAQKIFFATITDKFDADGIDSLKQIANMKNITADLFVRPQPALADRSKYTGLYLMTVDEAMKDRSIREELRSGK